MTGSTTVFDGGDAVGYDYTVLVVYTEYSQTGSAWGRMFWSQFDRSSAGEPGNPTEAQIGIMKQAGGDAYWWGATTDSGGFNVQLTAAAPDIFVAAGAGPIIVTVTYDSIGTDHYKFGTNVLNGVESCDPVCAGGYTGPGGVGTNGVTFLNRGNGYYTSTLGGLTYKLAEFIIYNKKLDDTERATMNTYLNDKYLVY